MIDCIILILVAGAVGYLIGSGFSADCRADARRKAFWDGYRLGVDDAEYESVSIIDNGIYDWTNDEQDTT